jgi:hypothetical protein
MPSDKLSLPAASHVVTIERGTFIFPGTAVNSLVTNKCFVCIDPWPNWTAHWAVRWATTRLYRGGGDGLLESEETLLYQTPSPPPPIPGDFPGCGWSLRHRMDPRTHLQTHYQELPVLRAKNRCPHFAANDQAIETCFRSPTRRSSIRSAVDQGEVFLPAVLFPKGRHLAFHASLRSPLFIFLVSNFAI